MDPSYRPSSCFVGAIAQKTGLFEKTRVVLTWLLSASFLVAKEITLVSLIVLTLLSVQFSSGLGPKYLTHSHVLTVKLNETRSNPMLLQG